MIKTVRLSFDKFLHDTGRATLIRVGGDEIWIPNKLIKSFTTNKKLGGHLTIPSFFLEKIEEKAGRQFDANVDTEIIHHIPEDKTNDEIKHERSLFRQPTQSDR